MNQELVTKIGRGVLFAFISLLLILLFFSVVFGRRHFVPMNSMMYQGGVGASDGNVSLSVVDAPLPTRLSKSFAPNSEMMRGDFVTNGQSVTNELYSTTSESVSVDKKVIKTGYLTLNVGNVDWSAGEIKKSVSTFGGSVDASNFFNNGQGAKSGTMTVRVPAEKFDEAFTKLKQLGGTVVNESVSGQDVTEQAIDLEARIKNKQAEEEAYANILKGQATKVSDVLEVTQALNNVRGEIESLQGQLKYLNSQANMSTISITLSEDPQVGKTDTTWRPWQVVKASVNALLVNLQGLIDFLIRLFIIVVPILLIVFGIIGWILWRVAKKVMHGLKGE